MELVPSAETESNLEGLDFMSALAEFSHGLEAGLEGLREGENPYTNSMFEYIPPAMRRLTLSSQPESISYATTSETSKS